MKYPYESHLGPILGYQRVSDLCVKDFAMSC
jgi:hypothetical protein